MINAVDLTSKMITYCGDVVGLPVYNIMIKVDHKKSQQEKLPIPYVTLMAIATKYILQYQ